MNVINKILCGSSELFKGVENFKPGDSDYILITDSDKTFEHQHPDEDTCWFIWGKDKEKVRTFIISFPYYLTAMSLVTKPFVDYYEFTHEQVVQAIDNFYNIFETSTYRYYIPLFDYIKTMGSWEFSEETLSKAYQLYKDFKKK